MQESANVQLYDTELETMRDALMALAREQYPEYAEVSGSIEEASHRANNDAKADDSAMQALLRMRNLDEKLYAAGDALGIF